MKKDANIISSYELDDEKKDTLTRYALEKMLKDIKAMLTQKETDSYRKLISIGITVIGTLATTMLGLLIYIAKLGH